MEGSRGVSAIQKPAHLRHSLFRTAAISSDVDVARDDTEGRGGAGEVNRLLGDFCEGRQMEESRLDTPAMRRISDWYTFLLLLPCCLSLLYFPLACCCFCIAFDSTSSCSIVGINTP